MAAPNPIPCTNAPHCPSPAAHNSDYCEYCRPPEEVPVQITRTKSEVLTNITERAIHRRICHTSGCARPKHADDNYCFECLTTRSPAAPAAGRKFDADKPRYDLVPPQALEEVAKVLTFGAQKYDDDNWKKVPGLRRRYFAAGMRHLWAWFKGERTDEETGLSHLAHAICCFMFMLELEDQVFEPNTKHTLQ